MLDEEFEDEKWYVASRTESCGEPACCDWEIYEVVRKVGGSEESVLETEDEDLANLIAAAPTLLKLWRERFRLQKEMASPFYNHQDIKAIGLRLEAIDRKAKELVGSLLGEV